MSIKETNCGFQESRTLKARTKCSRLNNARSPYERPLLVEALG